ncbi:hypothetical protein ERX37_09540 [Macrococcus hajekii]|uniref:Nuclear transport factor 2 family protein n=1 Tax=Macrococcus hajekii TaxID=198482 RepID=A0A4R6BIA1_9STAP|nr:hypothetical protein [Macrococcus hajekii]TDM01345.1 hypothetical protein ERX37_09540 [Macrococcus hajekii]GGB10849.1 hypothetical protein GCM10007190_18650 [Macrococcus hajekii]
MSYVHLLAAWQHQDLEEVKSLIDENVIATLVHPDGLVSNLSYEGLVDFFHERFSRQQDWNFEIIYKTERDTQSIVIMKMTREDKDFNGVDSPSLSLLTFNMSEGVNKLIRAHFELGLNQ